ncbi:MAG: YARHG domain-containing protein [Clostridia bacterium]|nr:YARHG domain-containing protein [Clostridia bacterium]
MKNRIIALLAALAIVLAGAAYAEPVFVFSNGQAGNMPENIPAEYNPVFIQRYKNTLYFVDEQAVDPDAYDDYIHTLYAMDAAGNVKQIGEARRYAREYEYNGDDYSYMTELTHYNGYSDMKVYGDHIYFIGTDDTAGSYTTHSAFASENGEIEDFTSTYSGTACVYRMDMNGGNLVKLISGLGNGAAHMDIANDRIAVSSCYMNNFFVYDFVDFMFYDMEGNLISKYEGESNLSERYSYMDGVGYNLLVESVLTDGESIYASLSDSEGDFASSRLVKLPDIENELLLEAYFVSSLMADNGAIVYFTSDAEDVFWDENMADSLTLRVYENGSSRILALIPSQYGEGWNQQLVTIGDMAYFMGDETILRVSLSGGAVERYENGGFVEAPECDPAYYGASSVAIIGGADGPTAIFVTESAEEEEAFYYLPDSNTRKYSRDELEQYDTETLGFMRNEILARHGYPFKKEAYRNHFESMPWYERNENFEYGMLNSIEMENVETIKKIEASR